MAIYNLLLSYGFLVLIGVGWFWFFGDKEEKKVIKILNITILCALLLLGFAEAVIGIVYIRNKSLVSSIVTTKEIDYLYKQDDVVYLRTVDGKKYMLSDAEANDSFKVEINDDDYSDIFVEKKDETYNWRFFYSEEETDVHIAYVGKETYNDIMNIKVYDIAD